MNAELHVWKHTGRITSRLQVIKCFSLQSLKQGSGMDWNCFRGMFCSVIPKPLSVQVGGGSIRG